VIRVSNDLSISTDGQLVRFIFSNAQGIGKFFIKEEKRLRVCSEYYNSAQSFLVCLLCTTLKYYYTTFELSIHQIINHIFLLGSYLAAQVFSV